MLPRLLFRVEADAIIGRGHVSRCMAVADMLTDEFEVLFVVSLSSQDYVRPIIGNHQLLIIATEEDLFSLLKKEDILWIDGYDFTEEWKGNVRARVRKLIETNDIPYPVRNVDIVFNHTPGLTKDMFKGGDPKTEIYLGLSYSLVRPIFRNIAKEKKPKIEGEGVFICFGGADTFGLGEKFTQALIAKNFQDPIYWVTAKVPVNSDYAYSESLFILSNLNEDEMVSYMSKAKVLIIPSSVLSFEAMALRKPFYTCYFVKNQELIYQGLTMNGLSTGNGYVELEEQVLKAVFDFLDFYLDNKKQIDQITNQAAHLDGRSKERINKILLKEEKI